MERGFVAGGGLGMDSRIRLHGGGLSVGKTEGGAGSRIRLHGGRFSAGGTGMGPRIREDNGGVRIREDNGWGRGRKDDGLGGVAGGGWDGFPHPSSREQRGAARVGNAWWGRGSAGTTDGGMDPRIREDKGEGWVPPLFTGRALGGRTTEEGEGEGRFPNRPYGEEKGGRAGWRCGWGVGWVPASVFTGTGSSRGQRRRGRGKGGSRTAPTERRKEGGLGGVAGGGWDGFPHPSSREQRGAARK